MQTPHLVSTFSAVPVAIYTRVSTQGQVGGRFDSCESQAAICRDFLGKRMSEGWHEVAAFTDAAYSGGTMDRPGIRALKRQIENGEIKVVLIFKLERVLRSTDEWGPFRSFLQKHRCRLVSTTEDLSEDTPSGRLKNNLLVSVAEYERLNTGEKVRAKMLEQAKRGFWNCGLVPFGYEYDYKTQKLSPHPTEAPVIRRIFEAVSRLVSLTEVANMLAEEGVRTRIRTHQARGGTEQTVGGQRFRSDKLRYMVRNTLYAGRIRFGGQDYPGQHEALVDVGLWERANAALEVKPLVNPRAERLRERDRHFNLLKGLVYCGHCGRAMSPGAAGKKRPDGTPYRYYICGQAQKDRAGSACPLRHVSAAGLEEAVVGFVGRLAQHPKVVNAAVAEIRKRTKVDRDPLLQEVAVRDQAIEVIAGQLRNCTEVISAGGIELVEELRAKVVELKQRRSQLIVERERFQQTLAADDREIAEVSRVREAMLELGRFLPGLGRAEKKIIMALCFERIEVRIALVRGGSDGESRKLEVACRIRLAELVEGMEQRLVVQTLGGKLKTETGGRLNITLLVELHRSGWVEVFEPFQAVFGGVPARRRKELEQGPARHAIHRALRWKARLEVVGTGLTQGALAAREKISPVTFSQHMRLLRLAPEIQKFLMGLVDRRAIRRYGLGRMRRLAKKTWAEQYAIFAAMRNE